MLWNDARQIWKDPMLMASLLGPLVVIGFTRFVFPSLSVWLERQFDFSLFNYSAFAVTFLLLTIPLLPGTMAGLLMLDERDENMISYYAATPLTRQGYLLYRLFLPSLLSLLMTALFFLLSGLTEAHLENMYTLLLLALEAPCLALFLAAFANNKVEGLALSKISGLLFAGPVVAAFVPVPWQYLGMWIPTFWPAKCYLLVLSSEPVTALGAFGGGLAFHLLLLIGLTRTFIKRID